MALFLLNHEGAPVIGMLGAPSWQIEGNALDRTLSYFITA